MTKDASKAKPVKSLPPRLARELTTVRKMLLLFCRHKHSSGTDLCNQCSALETYAAKRLANCPFGQQKPTCGSCKVHCYRPGMKDRIQEVMRFSGPRMIYRHPILAMAHFLYGRKFWQNSEDNSKKSPNISISIDCKLTIFIIN